MSGAWNGPAEMAGTVKVLRARQRKRPGNHHSRDLFKIMAKFFRVVLHKFLTFFGRTTEPRHQLKQRCPSGFKCIGIEAVIP